jgi:hypothetical protein
MRKNTRRSREERRRDRSFRSEVEYLPDTERVMAGVQYILTRPDGKEGEEVDDHAPSKSVTAGA